MSGFVPEYIEKPVPYCALVPNTKYRIQYHNVTAPGSGKAIGTFEKLMIDFDPMEDEDAEDADLEPMDTIGYAIFNHVHRVPGAKKPTGMDGFHTHGLTYAFPVFSQEGNADIVVANNEEISFYAYTVPEHQSRMFHSVLARHTHEDIPKEYKGMFGGKQRRNRNVTKKVRVVAPKRRRASLAKRRRSGRKIAGPGVQHQLSTYARDNDQVIMRRYRPTPYYPRQMDMPMTPVPDVPRQGALSWGDAGKLAAANIAAVVVGEGMQEAFEDV